METGSNNQNIHWNIHRNINEYIQLVRYIDKSLFDVLADLAPARAKVSKGHLHMLEREGLSDKEIEQGYVLTCQSVPRSNEIELSYE